MTEKKLVDFLKLGQKLKLNLESVGRELVKAGWSIKDVDEALKAVKPLKAPIAPMTAPSAPVALQKPKANGKLPEAEKIALEHIQKMRAQKLTDDKIKEAFVEKGWKEEVVNRLLAAA
jgi:hypothetical protein